MNFQRDQSLSTFSSEGKLKQCDYALQAALNGTLSVGACSKDGVVIGSLKQFSSLIDKENVFKVTQIADTIGMTYSGLQSDYRIMSEKACRIGEEYKDVYGRYPFVDVFVAHFSQVIQEYTQKGGLRPFGCMIFIAGPRYHKDGIVAALYQIDPSGSFISIDCGAIGIGYDNSAKFIESRMELLDDNLITCLSAMKNNAGYEVKFDGVDLGVYEIKKNKFSVLSREAVKELFDAINLQ